MMASPLELKEQLNDKDLDEIIRERDKIIESIRKFENDEIPLEAYHVCPRPEVVYSTNLEYLSLICQMILEKRKELYG